jgi:DNA-binding transcriptional MerR regulator/predicted transcriptional regulator YdeE
MRYKINQVKKILNISEDTLRYFDNKKLIRSKRDSNNNYRYFSSDDINKIFAYKMYRGLLFHMKDAEELISGKPVDNLEHMLQSQLQVIKNEQEYMEGAKRHIELLVEKIKQYQQFRGGFEIVMSPNCFFHGNQTDHYFRVEDETFNRSYKLLNSMPHIWPSFCYDPDKKDEDYQYSFGYGYYDEEEPPINGLTYLPARKSLYTFFTMENSLADKVEEILAEAEKFCEENGYVTRGKVYGNLLHEMQEKDKLIRLCDIYIPIRDK